MNPAVAVAVIFALAFAGIAAVPEVDAERGPPDLPPGSHCEYFHYHSGNLQQGTPPSYHYHHCI